MIQIAMKNAEFIVYAVLIINYDSHFKLLVYQFLWCKNFIFLKKKLKIVLSNDYKFFLITKIFSIFLCDNCINFYPYKYMKLSVY